MTLVIAHRGASKAAHENTLRAFFLAKEFRADWIELDVRRTQDGRLAVHHDAHLADGRVLCDTPADELPRHVPELAAALDACSPLGINIEIKNWPTDPDFDPEFRLAAQVVELLASRGNRDRVLISAFHLPTLDAVRALNGGLHTAWLVEAIRPDTLDVLLGHGHRTLHPRVRRVTRGLLDDCRERGITVNTWTCDDPKRMAQLVGWGIDGICTNVPDVARAVVDRQGGQSQG